MAKLNKKPTDFRLDKEHRLAGGYGPYAAKQDAEALLRRSVLVNLLWEDLAYEDGVSAADNIMNLIPQVDPEVCAQIAFEARTLQKLRHTPLLIARVMAALDTHKHLVGSLLPQIILRPDELAEFLAIYWKDGKQPLSAQVKKGLAAAFNNFDEYQLAKWNRDNEIKLRDVMFLTHPKPKNATGSTRALRKMGIYDPAGELFRRLAADELATPDTWEVALSTGQEKKETWERLIRERKLGALAFLRNLRNMERAGVDQAIMRHGFLTINPRWLLPLNYLAAVREAPQWMRDIEDLMFRSLANVPKLPGWTIFVVDVSGSMGALLASRSAFSRTDAAIAMAVLAAEMCEHVTFYATAGNDYSRVHRTQKIPPYRGFALDKEIRKAEDRLGGGGIFTRQVLEYIQDQERGVPDRIIIFSDSQDCDWPEKGIPNPFGKRNYIVDVSAHKHGINYQGLWTAEISGWSEHFLTYIAAFEGQTIPEAEE